MYSYFSSDVAVRKALDQAHKRACVDLVDLGPLDPDQMDMKNLRPSISLVTSNG